MSAEEAAGLLGISKEELDFLEDGTNLPNRTLLQKMSSKYKWRLEVLLMPDVLPPQFVVKDYRQRRNKRFDPNLSSMIEDVFSILTEISDLRADKIIDFPSISIPKITISSSFEEESSSLRNLFNLTEDIQLSFPEYRDFFQFLRYKIESLGVIVLLEKMDTSMCRGFALKDEHGNCIIAVNDREDSYAPKIFTLIHEFVHLMLDEPGISDQNDKNAIEVYCNKFSSAFLLPVKLIKASIGSKGPYSNREIYRMAKYLTVSQSSLIIRLIQLKYLKSGFYAEWIETIKGSGFEDRAISKSSLSKGRIPPHTKTIKNYGALVSKSIIESTLSSRLPTVRANQILGLGKKHFDSALAQSLSQINRVDKK